MTKQYYLVDYTNLTIRTISVDPDYNCHDDFLVVYLKSEKIYLPGRYKKWYTFFETKESALESLKSFCKAKIEKYEKKIRSWNGNMRDVEEIYTDHEFTNLET